MFQERGKCSLQATESFPQFKNVGQVESGHRYGPYV